MLNFLSMFVEGDRYNNKNSEVASQICALNLWPV